MKYIKVEAIIPINEYNFYLDDQDEFDFFTKIMNDKENISIHIFSNDIGDEVCTCTDFKWEFYNQNK